MSKYRQYKSVIVRKLISPSIRFEITQMLAWIREQLNRACLWRWEIARLPQQDNSPYDIQYVGRKAHRELARIILGIENCIDTTQASTNVSSRKVFVTEMPIPGALCVPQYLRAIVPLGKTIEEIMSGYDSELRRSIRKHRPLYHMQQALGDAEIDFADHKMLRPYASARHGSSANQIASEIVRRFALEFGRLDFVLFGDEVVACLLGNEHIRRGKRYWLLDRLGYPEKVFSDPKRHSVINSITYNLAIEWAIKNNFDYCDLTLCFARPNDGLLQYKSRRGAVLDRIGLQGYGYFHIRLPREGAAQFLWDTPLFAVERNKLTLHLGLPVGQSDDEFVSRYRKMGFSGLSKIYLHCARPAGEQLLAAVCNLYKHQNPPPTVESITST